MHARVFYRGGPAPPVTRYLIRRPPGEETHPPLSSGGPKVRLMQLSQQYIAVEAMRQAILVLSYMSLDAYFSRFSLRQHTPHQACMYAPLPEVQFMVNPRPDLPGLAGTHCLFQVHMGKDKGSLGIPIPV